MLKNIRRLHLHCLIAVLALLIMVPFVTGFDISRRITIIVDGQQKELRTNASRPRKILEEAGVVLEAGDGWKLRGPNKNIQDGSVLEVVRGVPFTVIRGEETMEYKSSKATVGEALRDAGIRFKKKNVYPDVKTPLTAKMEIYVLGKNEELHFSEVSVEIPVKYHDDHNVDFGIEQITSHGKEGKATVVSKRVQNEDGSHSLRELTREVVVEPEAKIIRRGMAKSVYTPEGYKRYKKKMVVEASAYVATGNRTAIGLIPYEGVVAVDPKVIPFYTKMYIPGYGIGMAGDTGGMIIGNRIDLFMDDYHRAIQWGRRDVEIYILEE